MRFTTLLSTIAVACFAGFGANAAVLDANHATTDNPNNNTGLGIVNTSLAQSFTAIGNGILQSVQFSILNLRDANGPATGDIGFDLRGLSGGSPDLLASSALFSTTVANADIDVLSGALYPWSVITVDVSAANIAVSSGDMLAFVLTSSIGQEFAVQTDYQDAYAGGMRFSQNGDGTGFGALSTADLTFSTTISAVPLPAALPLLLAGLAGLGVAGRRRRKAA